MLTKQRTSINLVRYWIILSIPLAYFLSQFVTFLLNIFGPLIQEDPALISLVVTLVFTMSKPVGGILFGIVFWIMSKNIGKENIVRNYLTIAACGLVLLFSSNQAIVLTVAPYPPFGLATVSFVGLSCYSILVGIYSSAISVSLDISLRRSICTRAFKVFAWHRKYSDGPRDSRISFKD